METRYLETQVRADLAKKVVFLGGPRQVGKTTLAKAILGRSKGYLNWDDAEHRQAILKRQLPHGKLWVFDEIHKYRSWRSYVKGLYDTRNAGQRILVTGSARLDFYRFGGDSLQGRYHYLRLHPLSYAELSMRTDKELLELLRFGGFPEPFFGASEIEARRWSREYRTRLIREDLISLERVQDTGNLELLVLRLPDLVGSPLSINALREDLQLSHKTVAHWLTILERLYAIFRLAPFGTPRIRAVKKEQKHYHYDWSLVRERGPRFENMIASHLLKWVNFVEDTEGRDVELRYFRDIDSREVDFVIVEDRKPVRFIECKWSDDEVSPSLRYLKRKFPNVDAMQVFATGKKEYVTGEGIRVCKAVRLLSELV